MNALVKKPSPAFVRFRESHHAIAKMFAAGWTISKVSQETGYTRRRLHLLCQDPAFGDLVMEYAKSIEDKIDEAADRYADLGISNMIMAELQLRERLADAEETGEFLPVRELLAITKDRADRFGYGPKSTRLTVNLDFAGQLDRAIERSSKVIEVQALPAPPSSQVSGPPAEVHASPRPSSTRRLVH